MQISPSSRNGRYRFKSLCILYSGHSHSVTPCFQHSESRHSCCSFSLRESRWHLCVTASSPPHLTIHEHSLESTLSSFTSSPSREPMAPHNSSTSIQQVHQTSSFTFERADDTHAKHPPLRESRWHLTIHQHPSRAVHQT